MGVKQPFRGCEPIALWRNELGVMELWSDGERLFPQEGVTMLSVCVGEGVSLSIFHDFRPVDRRRGDRLLCIGCSHESLDPSGRRTHRAVGCPLCGSTKRCVQCAPWPGVASVAGLLSATIARTPPRHAMDVPASSPTGRCLLPRNRLCTRTHGRSSRPVSARAKQPALYCSHTRTRESLPFPPILHLSSTPAFYANSAIGTPRASAHELPHR